MPGMGNIRHVLVANELASYREVLRLRPELVICSRATSLVRDRVPNWVELHPECENLSTFYLEGERFVKEQVDLSDLLCIVDRSAARTA